MLPRSACGGKKALPGVSVFSSTAEFDTYLAAGQRKILEGG